MLWMTKRSQSTTSTTRVDAVFPEKGKRQPILRVLRSIGTASGDTVTAAIPKSEYKVPLSVAVDFTTPGTTDLYVYVPVDVTAGHIVRGHTVTSSDFLLVPTRGPYSAGPPVSYGKFLGWTLKPITVVTDVAGNDYCKLTFVGGVGYAFPVGTQVFIVRAADVITLIGHTGAGSVERLNYAAGEPGCPLVVSSVSFGSNNCTNMMTVQYVSENDVQTTSD